MGLICKGLSHKGPSFSQSGKMMIAIVRVGGRGSESYDRNYHKRKQFGVNDENDGRPLIL